MILTLYNSRGLQISDGIAGDSLENSIKVFMAPFGLTLSSDLEIGPSDRLKAISQDDLKALKKMARAASDNEKSGFVPALDVGFISIFL